MRIFLIFKIHNFADEEGGVITRNDHRDYFLINIVNSSEKRSKTFAPYYPKMSLPHLLKARFWFSRKILHNTWMRIYMFSNAVNFVERLSSRYGLIIKFCMHWRDLNSTMLMIAQTRHINVHYGVILRPVFQMHYRFRVCGDAACEYDTSFAVSLSWTLILWLFSNGMDIQRKLMTVQCNNTTHDCYNVYGNNIFGWGNFGKSYRSHTLLRWFYFNDMFYLFIFEGMWKKFIGA